MPRKGRNPQPLDRPKLEEMALAYVARFATTRAKLEVYLRRKLRERGWSGDGDPGIDIIAERLVCAGYVDDAAYARAKSGSLLRRGYGMRRVSQALGAAGVEEQVRDQLRPSESQQRQAALAMTKKRRFGPFGPQVADPAKREKQVAAMLRAGHPLDIVRQLIDASDIESAEEWAAELQEDDPCD